ncbi:MAG: hypothetical protein HOP19_18500 [Acidobacteria bacterium]|nr:hypothetical protein [Acidobacteriota bacterium]
MRAKLQETEKPLYWLGDAHKELCTFPDEVQDAFGFALSAAQFGGMARKAKLLRGDLRGAIEIVEDFNTDTYRAVYTVKFEGVVYVLHAFQKKSKSGIATPKADVELIKRRLKMAQKHYEGMKHEDHQK